MEHNFSFDERTRRRYVALDPADRTKNSRFRGTVQLVKPGYVLIQPDEGPVVISKATAFADVPFELRQKVGFELSFSAKGPLAEHVNSSSRRVVPSYLADSPSAALVISPIHCHDHLSG